LTVSLAFSAALAAMGRYMFADMEMLLEVVNFFASLVVITVLFAMIYKVLPNVKIAWQDVWIGAAITALLFTVGKLLIGLYIGKSSVASSFGAAGPFVIILVWIYYSTQIFPVRCGIDGPVRGTPEARKRRRPRSRISGSDNDRLCIVGIAG
jgi:membrane protein